MSQLIESWLDSANDDQSQFPVNNLPYGVFVNDGKRSCCVAIGNQILDLATLESEGLIPTKSIFNQPSLNDFMALGQVSWISVRSRLTELLKVGGDSVLENNRTLRERVFLNQNSVQLQLPFKVAEFTDFYAGRHHAENVGTMFRGKDNALPPNWLHIPIGYNGRASSVVASGTDIKRPCGQLKAADQSQPRFGPSERLDIELEMGAVVGTSSSMGRRLSVTEADQHIFGYVLLNDWSARDIQAWEYQPLGPFQAKAFATSISPWVVPALALEPFRVPTPTRIVPLLDYLVEPGPMNYDINLEIAMVPAESSTETILAKTNFNEMYYSSAQQLAHHSTSGCPMNTGDLLGSGTISGPTKKSRGSLLELCWGGDEPITLDDGSVRCFLQDGDRVTLRGEAKGDGYRIGFGACTARILAASD